MTVRSFPPTLIKSFTLALLLSAALAACSSTPEPAPTPVPSPAPSAAAEDGTHQVRVVVASTDLAVGPNRFVFGVLDSDSNPLRSTVARTTFLYLDTEPYQTRAETTSSFVQWPSGRAGVYVARVSFDQAGRWGVVVQVPGEDEVLSVGQAGFVVKEQSDSPGLGRSVPPSENRTAHDVSDLSEITTSRTPDPDLYQMTIAQAVSSGRPTVVTFATPAFCQTATCGPQVEVVVSIKDRHKEQANFIHVEVFDNPKEMNEDFSKARLSPIMGEWGLLVEPFTFVLDSNGLVANKYEGFVTEVELEAALAETLGS